MEIDVSYLGSDNYKNLSVLGFFCYSIISISGILFSKSVAFRSLN